jgi:type IV pilus assembly protein PilY1
LLSLPIFGAEAALTIEDTPLFINSAGVPPNLIITLDDSGSMARGYTPDLCGSGGWECSDTDTRWTKSSYGNPMYYNPAIRYAPPPKG